MKRGLAISLVLCVLMISSGCSSKVNQAAVNSPGVQANQDIEVYGSIKAEEIKNIVIDFPARVSKVNVKEGQKVKNGTSIMTLDLKEYETVIKDKESEMVILKEAGSFSTTQKEKISSLERNIDLLKSKLNSTYIKSNEIVSDMNNGVVFELSYEPGDLITPSRKVCSLVNLDSLVVEADVPEEFLNDVAMGEEAEIVLVSDKSKEYKGKVTFISSKAIQKNGETVVPIEISIDNKEGLLCPDLSVNVKIKK